MSIKNNDPINYIEDDATISEGTFVKYVEPIQNEGEYDPISHCKIIIDGQEKTVEIERVKHADFGGTIDFQIALANIENNQE